MRFFCLFLYIAVFQTGFAQSATGSMSGTVNLDGTILYHIADSEGKSLLYKSVKDSSGVWLTGTPVSELNDYMKGAKLSTPFISYDNQYLYVSAKEVGSTNFDIYVSQRNGDKWGKPTKLQPAINTEADELSPSVAADNMSLYFARRPQNSTDEQKNCNTILCSKRTTDGTWAFPLVVEFPINSGCETSPLIAPDGKRLFFSSDRLSPKKKRRFNIMTSRRLASAVWSTPEPVDTLGRDYDEFAPSIDYKAKTLQITKVLGNKKESTSSLYSFAPADSSLFAMPFTIVKGTVRHSSAKPMECNIKLIDSYTSQIVAMHKSMASDGSYCFIVPKNSSFVAEFYTDTTTHVFRNIKGEADAKGSTLRLDVTLFSSVRLIVHTYDMNSMETIGAKISVNEANIKKPLLQEESKGQCSIYLPINKKYEVLIEKSGYVTQTQKINLDLQQQFEGVKQEIYLEPNMRACEIQISDADIDSLMQADVSLNNTDINERIHIVNTQTGIYSTNLRKDNRYRLTVFKNGYMYFFDHWEADAGRQKQILEVKLTPLSVMGKIDLPVYFSNDFSDLDTYSMNELKCLARLLRENPNCKFSLTISSADTDEDKKITGQRLMIVQSYLNRQNIPTKNYTLGSEKRPAQTSGEIFMDRLSIQLTAN